MQALQAMRERYEDETHREEEKEAGYPVMDALVSNLSFDQSKRLRKESYKLMNQFLQYDSMCIHLLIEKKIMRSIIYIDLQEERDKGLLVESMRSLSMILREKSLPDHVIQLLGYQLIELLLGYLIDYHLSEENGDALGVQINLLSQQILLQCNYHYGDGENRVVGQLLQTEADKTVIIHCIIKMWNRMEDMTEIQPLFNLLRVLLSNERICSSYFLTNDVHVFTEILWREIQNKEDPEVRGVYIHALGYLLSHTSYRHDGLHMAEEITSDLRRLHASDGTPEPVTASIDQFFSLTAPIGAPFHLDVACPDAQ